ncbi:MAG TPA: phosphatase PAP2 family protein [Egibacteraceae bacterium]|nr:phosphatase PAP2 family protein [Egibacteraceae bacterium]
MTLHRLTVLLLAVALMTAACGGSPASSEDSPPAEPDAGTWETWVLEDASEIAVPPPPEEGSPAAEADLADLQALTADRDEEAREAIERWDAEPAVGPWMEFALDFVAHRTKDPVAASRSYALVAVAMHDAAAAAWHHKYAYDRPGPEDVEALVAAEPDPSYPSGHAAIAGAASTVLAYAFPEQPALRLERHAEEAARSRVAAGVSFPSDVDAGLQLGRAVGELVLERAQADVVTDADVAEREGAANWEELRPEGELLWRQPPGSVQVPVSPMAGSWDTWVLESGDQFRPGPFPDVHSEQFRAEAQEVYDASQNLTEEQRRVAKFWEGGEGTALPPGIWNEVALAFLGQRDLSLPRAARAMALLNVAMDDAGVAAWDAKYAYWGPRPDTAIHDLGIDPDWEPYLNTPIFPGYVSGHGAYSGAAEMVMSHLFPDHAELYRERAEEASISRMYGGIHMRSDNEVGLDMGRKVGALVVEHAQQEGIEG